MKTAVMRLQHPGSSLSAIERGNDIFTPAGFLRGVEALRKQLIRATYPSLVAAVLSTCILFNYSPDQACAGWLIVFAIIIAARLYIGLFRYSPGLSLEKASEWYILFLAGCAITGAMWSYLGIMIIAGLDLTVMMLAFLHAINVLFVAGLAAWVLLTYRSSFTAFLAFSFPAVVPYALYLVMQTDAFQPVPGTLLLMYYLFLLLIGFNNHHSASAV